MSDRITKIELLLQEAGAAHHEAFMAVDGEDPDWANWYARYMGSRLAALLGVRLTQEELATWLEKLASDHANVSADIPWARYYAQVLASAYPQP